MTLANSNSAVGSDTLISNISGDCNVAIGESALLMNNTADNNIVGRLQCWQ
jgi:hypothetical protein